MQTKTENQLLMPKRKVYEEKMKPGKLPLARTSKPTENQNEEHEEAGLVFIPMTDEASSINEKKSCNSIQQLVKNL